MKNLLARTYGLIASSRAWLYERGILASQSLENPVVSVGNLTVGGTGKTPLVAHLAKLLKKGGYQPVILSRGYKGTNREAVLMVSDGREILCRAEECGDEPFLLARRLEGVPVIVGKRRYDAGRFFEQNWKGKVVHLLDDGFQHLQLKRDLNILVLDATDPFGGRKLIPAGRLREGLRALERADSIIVTRAHFPSDFEALEMQIREFNRTAPIAYFHHSVVGIYDLKTGVRFSTRDFFGKRVMALAAIGNPQIFLEDLAHYQIKVVDQFLFRDHHPYRASELRDILRRMEELKVDALITTEKDAVRLQNLEIEENRIFVLQIEAVPESPAEYKKELLDEMERLRR